MIAIARPPQDPQIRINEILNAAEPLFYAKGYHETAISDIAQKMGVAQGTLYYYFKSKEEILEALINRELSSYMARIKMTLQANNVPLGNKFQVVLQILFQSLHHEAGLTFGFLYNDSTIHLLDKIGRQVEQLLAPLLLNIIEEGNCEHYFHAAHPQAVVNIVLAILDSLINAIYASVPAEQLRCQFQLAEKLIETALGAETGTIQLLIDNELY